MLSDCTLFQTQEFKKKLNQCIHCGLCLQACPTYSVFGTEMDSPRGRITMIRAASSGHIAPEQFDGALSHHLALCLTCRACETVCPSGVQYNALVEPMREMIEHFYKPRPIERLARWLAFRQMMPYLGRLKFTARLLWLYEVIGLQRLVRHVGILPKPLKTMEAILPPIIPKYRDYHSPAPAMGKKTWAGCPLRRLYSGGISRASE